MGWESTRAHLEHFSVEFVAFVTPDHLVAIRVGRCLGLGLGARTTLRPPSGASNDTCTYLPTTEVSDVGQRGFFSISWHTHFHLPAATSAVGTAASCPPHRSSAAAGRVGVDRAVRGGARKRAEDMWAYGLPGLRGRNPPGWPWPPRRETHPSLVCTPDRPILKKKNPSSPRTGCCCCGHWERWTRKLVL